MFLPRFLTLTLLCWVSLASLAGAWDFRGHRVVAGVAWSYLGPVTRSWVEECLREHADVRARTPEGAAVWPDMIGAERPETSPWHYINLPIGPGPEPGDQDQVTWAVTHWSQVARLTGEPPQRAEALAFVLHFVGDIHQPLHCSSFYNSRFPSGDRGGNSVTYNHPIFRNLHRVWDMAGFPAETTVAEIQAEALRTSVGASGNERDPKIWAQESHLMAVNAYPAGDPPLELTDEYLANVRRISLQRLHQAGYRLAYLLQSIGPEAGFAQ